MQIRRKLQLEIDMWHLNNRSKEFNQKSYENFLKKIGYLKKEGPNFKIKTQNLDEEISKIPGPQLVVPISNARYVLNAFKTYLAFEIGTTSCGPGILDISSSKF